MKKTILSIALVAIFASCSNENKTSEPKTATQTIAAEDTIGLSDFKQWKEKQEVLSTQQTFTSPGINETPVVTEEKPAPVIIYRDAPARTQRVARSQKPASRRVYRAPEPEANSKQIAKAPTPPAEGTKREAYGRGTGTSETAAEGESTVSNDGDGDATTQAETPAKKNEGWSKAAKGTAIGGTSGAVIGAVISKNKTKGAVIGGIVGAAGGYIFGRKQDKKDGRY